MQNNKYIGNRYVPKHCGDWDNTKNTAYESLSVVLWEGNSFTSKQNVPKGIDITSTEYWVKSANYNAQIAIYEQNIASYRQFVIDQIGLINDGFDKYKIDTSHEFDVEFDEYKGQTTAIVDAFKTAISGELSDLAEQKYYKTLPKTLNGANMMLPFSSNYGTYQTVVDNAVALGSKCLNICVRFNMTSNSSESMINTTDRQELINVVTYAKSKGLKIFIKPHMNFNTWDIYSNVASPVNWLTSYSSLLFTCVSWVKDSVDIVGISNELQWQTSSNLALWETLINNIRALNSNITISCSITASEISTNLYLPYIDYLGCNLYIRLNGDMNSSISTLRKSLFKDYVNQLDYIDIMHKKSIELGIKILVTEFGILPMSESIKSPGKWDYDDTYFQTYRNPLAQTKYYEAILYSYMNDAFVEGVMVFSLTDAFTPIGNIPCENIIKSYFGVDV